MYVFGIPWVKLLLSILESERSVGWAFICQVIIHKMGVPTSDYKPTDCSFGWKNSSAKNNTFDSGPLSFPSTPFTAIELSPISVKGVLPTFPTLFDIQTLLNDPGVNVLAVAWSLLPRYKIEETILTPISRFTVLVWIVCIILCKMIFYKKLNVFLTVWNEL